MIPEPTAFGTFCAWVIAATPLWFGIGCLIVMVNSIPKDIR